MTNNTDTIARPLVDFSTDSRATARDYAAAADSRILKTESRVALQAAAKGGEVDAYALNAAVVDAMRSATTRLGQSMARRDLARKVAYLGHIAQAVIENHADGLPTYDSSVARSRKVQELSREISHSTEVNQALTRDLTAARDGLRFAEQSFAEERATLTEEAREHAAGRVALDQRLTEVIAEKTKAEAEAAEAVQDRDVYAAAVAYILESLDTENKARVLGYLDGVRDGLKD